MGFALFVGSAFLGSIANADPTTARLDVLNLTAENPAFVAMPNNYWGPWNSPAGTLQVPIPTGGGVEGGTYVGKNYILGEHAPNLADAYFVPNENCWFPPSGSDVAVGGQQPHAFRGTVDDCGGSYMGNITASMNSSDGWSTNMPVNVAFANEANKACAGLANCPTFVGIRLTGDSVDAVGLVEVNYDPELGHYTKKEGAVPVSVEVQSSGTRLFIQPMEMLKPSTTYAVWVTNELIDTNNEPVQASADFTSLIGSTTGCSAHEDNQVLECVPNSDDTNACDAPKVWGVGGLCDMTRDANTIALAYEAAAAIGGDPVPEVVYAAVYTTASTAQGIQAVRNAMVTLSTPVFDCYENGECKGGPLGNGGETKTVSGEAVWGAWNPENPDFPEKNPEGGGSGSDSSAKAQYQDGMPDWYEDLYAMKIVKKAAMGCTYPQPIWETGLPDGSDLRVPFGEKGEPKTGVQKCKWLEDKDGIFGVLGKLKEWAATYREMNGFNWDNYVSKIKLWGNMSEYHGYINLPIFLDSTYDVPERYPGGPMSGWKYNPYRSISDSTWAIHKNYGDVKDQLPGNLSATATQCFDTGVNCGLQTEWNPDGMPFTDFVKLGKVGPLIGEDGPIDVHRAVTRYAPLPAVNSVRQVQFILLMPKGPQVRRYVRKHGGVPVVVYTHGVTAFKDTMWMLAPGVMHYMRRRHATPTAVIAISQPLHGDRRISRYINETMEEGGKTDVYINIQIAAATRGNFTQSVVDTMGLVLGLNLAQATQPGSYLDDLDGSRVFTVGHSLGALTNYPMSANGNQTYQSDIPLPYKCGGVGCRDKTPFNPVDTTADVFADPGQGIGPFMLVSPAMAGRMNAGLMKGLKKYNQFLEEFAGKFPPNTCNEWDFEKNGSNNCVIFFKETYPAFAQLTMWTLMFGVQTGVDMVDPNNSAKVMPSDQPFYQINAVYEGTIPSYVYDNPLAGGGPLSDDPRWGNPEGLETFNKSIKCREHAVLGKKKCKPLQMVGWYGSTAYADSRLLGAAKTGLNYAYHITLLGLPFHIHQEMVRNMTSFWASDGTEVTVTRRRFLQKEAPPRCYITHSGTDVSFTGIPLTASQLGDCPGRQGSAQPAPPKGSDYTAPRGS